MSNMTVPSKNDRYTRSLVLIMITENLLVYHIYPFGFLIVIFSHTTITNTFTTEMVWYTFVSWFSLFAA